MSNPNRKEYSCSEKPNSSDTISRQAAIDALKGLPTWWADAGGYYGGAQPPMVALLDPEDAVSAIESLPYAQETHEERTETHACDLISRQAAISAICNACGKIDCDKMGKCEKLQLPPANCSEFPNNSDTISRQDAVSRRRLLSDLKELITAWEKYPVMAEQIKGVEVAIEYVESLPSAQPERKKGSWNVIQGDIVVCSECGMCAPKSMTGCLVNRHLEPNRTNFCPNCGADMRGEQDG